MKLTWVTFNVRDMERSLEFYRKWAGLSLNRRFSPREGSDIAFLGSEGTSTELELICNSRNGEPRHGKDISLGFAVPSLDRVMGELEKEGIPYQGPFSPAPSVRYIYVEDPDGVKVQFHHSEN